MTDQTETRGLIERLERVKYHVAHLTHLSRAVDKAIAALSQPREPVGREDADELADYIRDQVCCPRAHGCEVGGTGECPAERVRAALAPISPAPNSESADGWQRIESAPFTFDTSLTPPTKWLGWHLLGRFDKHGWVEWVGGMDADEWLLRYDDRACAETVEPTHFHALPIPPAQEPQHVPRAGDQARTCDAFATGTSPVQPRALAECPALADINGRLA